MVRAFAENEVEPQALEYNRAEKFNIPLFRKLGDLGLLGITVPEEYGGSGMDATAMCIAMEEVRAKKGEGEGRRAGTYALVWGRTPLFGDERPYLKSTTPRSPPPPPPPALRC